MQKEYQDTRLGITIYDHGESVCKEFNSLFDFLCSEENIYHHPIPNWLITHRQQIISSIAPHIDDINTYLLYHDCGKPYCLEIDINGKRHFPNHAKISQETFLKYSSNQFIAELIAKDMLCHTTKPKDYMLIAEEKHIHILLFSALAEIHSNAQMFGGFDSDSFKIKFKNLDKLGQRILNQKHSLT